MAVRTSPPKRADHARNHAQLLAVAARLVARDGADVSLEEIAREAGVGSATVHRHFPSRRALLEEVFVGGVEALADRALECADADPRTALFLWLEELTVYAASTRGLAESLVAERDQPLPDDHTCHGTLGAAADRLVALAADAGTLHPGIAGADVLTIANGISMVTQDDPAEARRLLRLAIQGLATD